MQVSEMECTGLIPAILIVIVESLKKPIEFVGLLREIRKSVFELLSVLCQFGFKSDTKDKVVKGGNLLLCYNWCVYVLDGMW